MTHTLDDMASRSIRRIQGSDGRFISLPIDVNDRIAHCAVRSDSGCVEWKRRGKDGYGVTSVTVDGKEKPTRAHRWVWERLRGPIPEGLVVMHVCDNPPCVNIDHLRIGTIQENTHDMMLKGRHKFVSPKLKGDLHPAHKLTDERVREIRQMADDGINHCEIHRRLGGIVSRTVIQKIATRKLWRHVA